MQTHTTAKDFVFVLIALFSLPFHAFSSPGQTPAGSHNAANVEVLSDTEGVDFGPWMQQMLREVRKNWDSKIPKSARMKQAKVDIELSVTKSGKVEDMWIPIGSGDASLDQAAWSGITAANPLPPLPGKFSGPSLTLRFRFYYNPDKADLEEVCALARHLCQ
jgi:TonB family protein